MSGLRFLIATSRSILLASSVVVAGAVVSDVASQTRDGDIVARGRIEPQGGIVVVSGPPESLSTVAIVDKLLVEQGDKVTVGQILAVINGYDLAHVDYDVALANLNVARLQRAQLQAGVGKIADIAAQTNVLAARQAQLIKAEKDWNRATMLVQKNAASVQLLDAQQATLDQITQEVAQSQNTIKGLTEVRPVDDALAAAQVAVAEANVKHAQATMERLQVRARAPGTVLSIQTRGGEVISSSGILRLGDLDHLIVVAEVDESQVQRVKLGMAASIKGALFADAVPAVVSRIAEEIYRQKRPSSDVLVGRDARIVEVELKPRKPLPNVIGAEVTVQFLASSGTQ